MKSILLIVFLMSFAFKEEFKIKGDIHPYFDVTETGEKLVFSISSGSSISLYQYNLNSNETTQLTEAKEEQSHTKPVYSSTGDTVLYILRQTTSPKSTIVMLNVKTGESKSVYTSDKLVNEVILNKTGNNILFCLAESFRSYSPLANAAAHNLDIFKVNFDGSELNKLTEFDAYSLGPVSIDNSGDTLLFKVVANKTEKLDGIYRMSISNPEFIEHITAANNPRTEIGNWFYNNPCYSYNNTLISFTAPYQLYTLNLADKKCKEIWSTFGKDNQAQVISSRFVKSSKNIFFSTINIEGRSYAKSAQFRIADIESGESSILEIN